MNEYSLSPEFSYVIVPDLHGEYRIVEDLIRRHGGDDGIRFIFLGDLVDRGESSHKTFRLVKSLIDSGKAHGVISNHDNKFYRFLKKWLFDTNRDKYLTRSEFEFDDMFDKPKMYGMTLSHGLQKTVLEFYSLDSTDMDAYAKDFISYFESLAPYHLVIKGDTKHYFCHAGISHNSARGIHVNEADRAAAMYTIVHNASEVAERFAHEGEHKVILHVGHHHVANQQMIFWHNDSCALYQHDIGIGKRVIDYTEEGFPAFVMI
jgi:hypothetical protein